VAGQQLSSSFRKRTPVRNSPWADRATTVRARRVAHRCDGRSAALRLTVGLDHADAFAQLGEHVGLRGRARVEFAKARCSVSSPDDAVGNFAKRPGPDPASSALDGAQMTGSRVLRLVGDAPKDVERSGVQRDAAEPLQAVADPVAVELEAALAMRRTGADPKALRRALRRIEELLDE
jgi:hypothetical protein